MNYSIIISEFNPFSNGHQFILNKTKELFPTDPIIIIMSGNFVQRGEPAIIDKHIRAEVATSLGADAVIELPTLFSLSSAEDFAYGAIKIASSIKNASRIVFGSECGDINQLTSALSLLNNPQVENKIKEQLKSGNSYATSLRLATKDYTDIFSSPNNLLGIEYLKAIKNQKSNLDAITIKREYSYTDLSINKMSSSSAIRECVYNNELDKLSGFMPDLMLEKLKNSQTPILDRLYSLLCLKLITATPESLRRIDGITEGLEFRILDKYKTTTSYPELISALATKRYPESKIKRILLNILLDITTETKEIGKTSKPIYNILAIKNKAILKDLSESEGSLITKLSDTKKLDTSQTTLHNLTTTADKVYAHLTKVQTLDVFKHRL